MTDVLGNFKGKRVSATEACMADKKLKEATAEELKEELRKKCKHENTHLIREGVTGTLGTVICLDCGYERNWNAY